MNIKYYIFKDPMENKRYNNVALFLQVLIFVVVGLTVAMLLSGKTDYSFDSSLFLLFISSTSIIGLIRARKKQRSSFLEITEDEILYKPEPKNKVHKIKINQLENVEVKLTEVHLKAKENSLVINLSFFEYRSVLEIKKYFENIQATLN